MLISKRLTPRFSRISTIWPLPFLMIAQSKWYESTLSDLSFLASFIILPSTFWASTEAGRGMSSLYVAPGSLYKSSNSCFISFVFTLRDLSIRYALLFPSLSMARNRWSGRMLSFPSLSASSRARTIILFTSFIIYMFSFID